MPLKNQAKSIPWYPWFILYDLDLFSKSPLKKVWKQKKIDAFLNSLSCEIPGNLFLSQVDFDIVQPVFTFKIQ